MDYGRRKSNIMKEKEKEQKQKQKQKNEWLQKYAWKSMHESREVWM